MKINTKTTLKGFDGIDILTTTMKYQDRAVSLDEIKTLAINPQEVVVKQEPFLLRTVLIQSLSFQDQELKATAEQSMRAYILGTEIMTKDEVELTAEDIVFIKPRLLKSYSSLVYGQVVQILEDKKEVVEEKKPE